MKTLYIVIFIVTSVVCGSVVTAFTSSCSSSNSKKNSHHHLREKILFTHIVHTETKRKTALNAVPLDVVSTLYNQALLTNPLETKLATGGVLALAGDAIAQSREVGEYDTKRAGAFITFDILYRAFQCASFPEITRICDGHYLGSLLPGIDVSVLATVEQTMANQFFVIPLFYYPLFFSLTGYVQGLTIEATIERAQTTIFPLLRRNWSFWLPVQYFQFGYVDEPLQIPFLCVVGLAWTFILSVAAGSVNSYEEEGVVMNTNSADIKTTFLRSNTTAVVYD
mmetsp:Transcript_840/g.1312  ORF Transcript_840/g.1312 Transcript_840/m.1312 type:complete len:281 (-) Transcript_840:31-873(-)